MLFGDETPKIDMPFLITIDKDCNSKRRDSFIFLSSKMNLHSLFFCPKFQ